MNRRELFARLGVAAAALVVAPSAQTEAAPVVPAPLNPFAADLEMMLADAEPGLMTRAEFEREYAARPPMTGWVGQSQGDAYTPPGKRHDEIGCSTCWAIEHQPHVPLTFDAMVQDCAARGCRLEPVYPVGRMERTWLHSDLRSTSIWGSDVYKVLVEDAALPTDLAGVDAWRQSLHGEEG